MTARTTFSLRGTCTPRYACAPRGLCASRSGPSDLLACRLRPYTLTPRPRAAVRSFRSKTNGVRFARLPLGRGATGCPIGETRAPAFGENETKQCERHAAGARMVFVPKNILSVDMKYNCFNDGICLNCFLYGCLTRGYYY